MNSESKKYYQEVRSIFPSMGKNEKYLLKNYRERILELNETHPDISYEELTKILGTPVEIITEYYESVDTPYLMRRLRTTKLIRKSIYIILLVIVLSLFTYLGFNIKLYNQARDSVIIRQETIIK